MATRKIRMRGGQTTAAKTAVAKPAAKVTTPAAKPAAKVTTPAAKPAAKVTTPAAKPAAKVTTPAAKPAAKMTTPAAKPAAKPATPAAKPAAKPATPAAKPAVAKPAVAKPAVAKPAVPGAKPATPVAKPAVAKPAVPGAKPATAVAKPAAKPAVRPATAAKPAVRPATAARPATATRSAAAAPGGAIEITEDEYDGDVNPDYVDPIFDTKRGVYWAYFQSDNKFYKIYGTPQDNERSLLDKIKKIKDTVRGASPSNSLRIGLEQEKLDITARIPRLQKRIKELTVDLKSTPTSDPKRAIYSGEIGVAEKELVAYRKRLVQITTAVRMLGARPAVGGRSRRNRRADRRTTRRATRRNSFGWW